ncbi:MAG: hypothetical protein HQK99_10625 [Nitrospirae bacterium]|nr:hypothetical protein [Nitrospirota bacterium]
MKSSYLMSIYRNEGPLSLVGIVKYISSEETKVFKTLEELEAIIREIAETSQVRDEL